MAALASSNAGKPQKAKGKPRGKPIQKGQVLNPKGRPVGSRQKLSEDFITALSADFEANGVATLQKMRTDKPDAYIRVVADLVPKDINLNHNATDAFLDLWKAMSGQGDASE